MSSSGFRRTAPLLLALFLIFTIFLGAAPSARADEPSLLQDYETDAPVAATAVSVPGHDAVARVPYASHGDSGLEFTVAPIGTPGSTASGGITLNQDTAALPTNDWSGHDFLIWDFWMPSDYTTSGRITIRDTKNVAWGVNYAIRGRAWTAVQVRLADAAQAGVDISSIKYIGISIPRRSEPVKVYYDALRLVDGNPDNSAFGARVVQNLIKQVDFPGILDGVDARLAEAAELLGDAGSPSYPTMKAQLDDLAAKSSQIRSGLDSIKTVEAYNTMIKTVDTLVAAPARLEQILRLRQTQPMGMYGLDTADSMSLVYPKDKTWVGTGTSPELELARGEAEHVQAVVVPYGAALSDVALTIDAVRGPDGKPAPASVLAATVAPIGSLYTVPSSAYGRPTYTGWTPDPIRADLASVDIPVGDIQPYLISVESGRDAKPGSYKVTVRVRADGQPDRKLSVAVTVWPITPQDRPELRTAFQFTPWLAWDLYGITDPDERRAMRRKYWDFLAEHKIQPDQIYTTANNPANPGPGEIRPQPAADILEIKQRYGLKQFTALYLWAGLLDPNKPDTWDTQIDLWIDQLETAMAEYEKVGVADQAVVYGFDESTGPMLQAAKYTFSRIKERFPNLPTMTTLRDDTFGQATGLTEQVDIWVPWIDGYRQDVADAARQRGERIWWYHAISTRYPQPNWFNGYPPIDTRMLMGAMSHQAGVEGILYYATNRWPRADRGDQLLVDDGILSKWNPATFYGTAGDGSLYYPGADGPMSSLRFENVRDGLEDYNLMQELRRAIKAKPDAPRGLIDRAEQALGAQAVVTDSRHFTEDPALYREWRREVAATTTLLLKF